MANILLTDQNIEIDDVSYTNSVYQYEDNFAYTVIDNQLTALVKNEYVMNDLQGEPEDGLTYGKFWVVDDNHEPQTTPDISSIIKAVNNQMRWEVMIGEDKIGDAVLTEGMYVDYVLGHLHKAGDDNTLFNDRMHEDTSRPPELAFEVVGEMIKEYLMRKGIKNIITDDMI